MLMRRRACDTREPVTYADCARERDRAQKRLQEALAAVIRAGDVDALADYLRIAKEAHAVFESVTGRPDEDWPRWYAEFLLGRR